MGKEIKQPDKNEKIQKKALEVNLLYKRVFATPEGEEVLKDLVATSGLMFTSPSLEQKDLAFIEGQRSIVLRIIQAIQMDPNTYIKLLENIRDEQEEIFK